MMPAINKGIRSKPINTAATESKLNIPDQP
jgi:hypothetical protein